MLSVTARSAVRATSGASTKRARRRRARPRCRRRCARGSCRAPPARVPTSTSSDPYTGMPGSRAPVVDRVAVVDRHVRAGGRGRLPRPRPRSLPPRRRASAIAQPIAPRTSSTEIAPTSRSGPGCGREVLADDAEEGDQQGPDRQDPASTWKRWSTGAKPNATAGGHRLITGSRRRAAEDQGRCPAWSTRVRSVMAIRAPAARHASSAAARVGRGRPSRAPARRRGGAPRLRHVRIAPQAARALDRPLSRCGSDPARGRAVRTRGARRGRVAVRAAPRRARAARMPGRARDRSTAALVVVGDLGLGPGWRTRRARAACRSGSSGPRTSR